MKTLLAIVLSLVLFSSSRGEENLARHLQDVSVTIRAGTSEGSGVVVTREVNGEKINFVWTAGHVVDGLRSVRPVIDTKSGSEKQQVVFGDAQVIKELNEDGRRVGELKMDAKVVKFSNFHTGEDLALLEIRKKDFVKANAKFYLKDGKPDNQMVPIGTKLYHVGSLLGQMGSNSMTDGIMSQQGRVVDDKVFDQTTVTAFPGSSGGGVYLAEGENKGEYIGMLVRGAGEGFNLIVPVRRLNDWAKRSKIEWAVNPAVATPSTEEREKILVEDSGTNFSPQNRSDHTHEAKFMIRQPLGYDNIVNPEGNRVNVIAVQVRPKATCACGCKQQDCKCSGDCIKKKECKCGCDKEKCDCAKTNTK